MSSAIENLSKHYADQIDDLDDETAQLEARMWLEIWQGCMKAMLTLTGKTLQSYSIAGRSFAFRTPADAKQAADGAKHEMLNLLGRAESGAALIDHSGGRW